MILSAMWAAEGKQILFVGTKKQARNQSTKKPTGQRLIMSRNRWLGGMLTNFQTIKKNINRLEFLNTIEMDGRIEEYPKKERV